MTDLSSFAKASKAVEESLELLNRVDDLASRGFHNPAITTLKEWRGPISDAEPVIHDCETALDAVAEGTPPLGFSNYHRAALQLWTWVELEIQRANKDKPLQSWE